MKEWLIFKSNQKNPESEILYNKLSPKNKRVLDVWLYEKSIRSKSEKRAGNRKRTIVKFLDFVEKDWSKINYDDYVNVASAISKSKNGVKQKNGDRYFVGKFLKDIFSDWEKKFKKLELLKIEQEGDERKLSPKDLLTELEIDKLIKATSNMKYKALISVLSTTAGRPEEILKLRWNDIDFSKNLIYLYSAKTKRKRIVPIGFGIGHLKRLKEESDSTDSDLIFYSTRKEKQLTISAFSLILKKLSKDAKINKRVFGYLFRHTILSKWITKLSPKVYEEISGHSLQMGMRTYAHLSQDKIIAEMNERIFEIKELSPDEKKEMTKIKEEMNKQKILIEKLTKFVEFEEEATFIVRGEEILVKSERK